MSQDQLQTDLLEILVQDDYSCYEISKVLNQILETNGKKEIRSQMMYNYARNKLIVPKVALYGETLRRITKAEVAAFLVKYMTRNGLTIKVANPDQMELDLEM